MGEQYRFKRRDSSEGRAAKRPREQERKLRELEDARRDGLTVLIANVALRATEQDIAEFFARHAGKVRATKLVTDSRGKSKGIGYVEFEDSTAVLKSFGLTGSVFMGQPIRVQASQAEKNRAARSAKAQQDLASAQAPTRLYVGNLVDELADLGPADLRMLFSPFGKILHIEVPKDQYTDRNRGFAIIQYADSEQARDAMLAMHNFEIQGRKIRVGFADAAPAADKKGRAPDAAAKRDSGRPPLPEHCSEIICLSNMYTKAEIEQHGVATLDEIEEDVITECIRYGVVIDIVTDEERLDGKLSVRFSSLEDACDAYRGLQGRYFGGQRIEAAFMDPSHFSQLKAQKG